MYVKRLGVELRDDFPCKILSGHHQCPYRLCTGKPRITRGLRSNKLPRYGNPGCTKQRTRTKRGLGSKF